MFGKMNVSSFFALAAAVVAAIALSGCVNLLGPGGTYASGASSFYSCRANSTTGEAATEYFGSEVQIINPTATKVEVSRGRTTFVILPGRKVTDCVVTPRGSQEIQYTAVSEKPRKDGVYPTDTRRVTTAWYRGEIRRESWVLRPY